MFSFYKFAPQDNVNQYELTKNNFIKLPSESVCICFPMILPSFNNIIMLNQYKYNYLFSFNLKRRRLAFNNQIIEKLLSSFFTINLVFFGQVQ